MHRRLLEYKQKYSNAQCQTQKLVVLIFILPYINRQYFPLLLLLLLLFFNWYQNREDWSVMGAKDFQI